jgi:hypothetical protein
MFARKLGNVPRYKNIPMQNFRYCGFMSLYRLSVFIQCRHEFIAVTFLQEYMQNDTHMLTVNFLLFTKVILNRDIDQLLLRFVNTLTIYNTEDQNMRTTILKSAL